MKNNQMAYGCLSACVVPSFLSLRLWLFQLSSRFHLKLLIAWHFIFKANKISSPRNIVDCIITLVAVNWYSTYPLRETLSFTWQNLVATKEINPKGFSLKPTLSFHCSHVLLLGEWQFLSFHEISTNMQISAELSWCIHFLCSSSCR